MCKRVCAHCGYDPQHRQATVEFFSVFVKHFSEVVIVLVVCSLRHAQRRVVLSPSALQFQQEAVLG